MKNDRKFHYDGFSTPNGTIVPDDVFDVLLPQLSDCELRVLLYIIRRTFGFKKDQDDISLKQMVEGIRARDGRTLDGGTGLSKPTVARGLVGLREKGIIVAVRNRSAEKGDEPTTYRLRFKGEDQQAMLAMANRQVNDTSHEPLSRRRDTPPVSAARPPMSQQRDTQQTAGQQTDFDLSKFERSHAHVDKSGDGGSVGASDAAATGGVEPDAERRAGATPAAGYATLGELIERRRRTAARPAGASPRRPGRSPGSPEERELVAAYLGDWVAELGDEAPLSSTVTRALSILKQAGLPQERWSDLLYQARARTREHSAQIRKKPSGSSKGFAAKNRTPYFFAILEDLAGLRPDRPDQPVGEERGTAP